MNDNRYKSAQYILKPHTQSCWGGFNTRISGGESDHRDSREHRAGYELADSMIDAGKIYYIHEFHSTHSKCAGLVHGFAFQYGGSFVCNCCGGNRVERPWWKIKVFQDGDSWCCVGEGFENLQESDNFAFGNTKAEAIKNYGDLMWGREKPVETVKESSHD